MNNSQVSEKVIDQMGKQRLWGKQEGPCNQQNFKHMHRKCQEISIIVKLSCPFGEIGTIGCFFEVSAHLCTQLGEKQEELETSVSICRATISGIREILWDVSYNWSAAMDGYGIFRENKTRRCSI